MSFKVFREFWRESSKTFKIIFAISSFLGVGKLLMDHFLGRFPEISQLLGIIVVVFLIGYFVGYYINITRRSLGYALKNLTMRKISIADTYREIGEIVNFVIKRNLEYKHEGDLQIQPANIQPQLISILERAKWILGEKVYNVSWHILCQHGKHLTIVSRLPPDTTEREPFSVDESTAGESIKTKTTIVVQSIIKERRVKYQLSNKYVSRNEIPYLSMICMPLILGQSAEPLPSRTVLGVFCISSLSESAFNENDEVILKPIISQLTLLAYFMNISTSECKACKKG